jgi:hypothetical protein
MEYMRWSKTHPRVRLELTVSDIPRASPSDIGASEEACALDAPGSYGHPDLIQAVAERYGVAAEGVVLVPGASSGIFIGLACAARRGETILLESPVYQPVRLAADFLGLACQPLPRPPEKQFSLDEEAVETGLTRGARAVVLTNLHNPSGQYLSPEWMARIARLCQHHDAFLVVDEVYLDSVHLVAGTPRWTAASFGAGVIAFSSLTKVYGLSGLRTGWILMDAKTAERARSIMDLLSVNNAAPAMHWAIRAFQHIHRLEERFRRRHREGYPIYRAWLAGEPLVSGYPNHGAIYECLKLPEGVTGDRLNDLLTTEYDTQVVPGRFFGLEDHVRLTIAGPAGELSEALSRISRALRRLIPSFSPRG